MQETKEHLYSLHILRGIAVVLMIITHVWIILFWDIQNPIGSVASFVGGYLSFTIFLFISGFLLGHRYKELSLMKQVKRGVVIMIAYFFLGIVYIITHKQSVGYIFTAPVFLQEYLLTLAVMPIFGFFGVQVLRNLPIVKPILKHHVGAFIFLAVGLGLVIAGKWFATLNSNFYLSLIFGSLNYHTFPIISYAIVYGVGGWLGWARRTDNKKDFTREAITFILLAAIITLVSIPLENINFSVNALDKLRWPPTVFFIFSTLGIGITLLLGCLNLEAHAKKFPLNFFVFLGEKSLHFVVIHILILFILEPYVVLSKTVPQVQGAQNIVPSLTPEESFIRTLEESYKNINTWQFVGTKVALITSTRPLLAGPAQIEVKPQEIGANASANDVALYVASDDEVYTKIDHSVALSTTGQYYLAFTVPDNTTRIAVSFIDEPSTPSHEGLDQILQHPANLQGEKLQVIDKNFTNWGHKNFTMEGKKWIVRTKKTPEKLDVSAFLPFSCEEINAFKNSGTVAFKLQSGTEITTKECTPITLLQTKLPVARSMFEFELSTETLLQKTEKQDVNVFLDVNFNEEVPRSYKLSKRVAVTEPLYVMWSLDWEGLQANKASMDVLDTIRAEQPDLKIVHMFNPRIWNTTTISKSVADAQVAFIKDKLTKNGDEVAVHLHMFKDILVKAEVTPIEEPGWGNRTDGYDTPFSSYNYENSRKILKWTVQEFQRKGLPRPVSIRAGGWFMNLENLRALKDEGFLIDTSGRTKYTSKSFGSGPSISGFWNLQPTTQPYWISKTDQNKAATSVATRLGIYEIPNNSGDSWAFAPEAMIARFKDNYSSEVLSQNRVVVFLSHPDFLNKEGPKIEQVLRHVKYYSSYNDSGPVVYITMKDYFEQYAK